MSAQSMHFIFLSQLLLHTMGAMVCTSLGSLLRPLFYFLEDVSYPQSVLLVIIYLRGMRNGDTNTVLRRHAHPMWSSPKVSLCGFVGNSRGRTFPVPGTSIGQLPIDRRSSFPGLLCGIGCSRLMGSLGGSVGFLSMMSCISSYLRRSHAGQ